MNLATVKAARCDIKLAINRMVQAKGRIVNRSDQLGTGDVVKGIYLPFMDNNKRSPPY
jgi:hypothetical protein